MLLENGIRARKEIPTYGLLQLYNFLPIFQTHNLPIVFRFILWSFLKIKLEKEKKLIHSSQGHTLELMNKYMRNLAS